MLAWLVLISLMVLIPSVVLSRIAASQVYRYVEKNYPELWKSMNTPTTATQYSAFFSKRGSFILKHEYKKLNDAVLNKKARLAMISFQMMLGSLVILIVATLTYELIS
ncbi:hypothetical protein [Thiofilum flexile]|uniref:hypothetical protein n=1 Tax=Thiofilum flexile TaxID=125627 RepID=UPI0003638F1A|nr:hypothetical protein [Thiofilum flexile]